ncbi:MAG: 50S ribosomal protein L3, partial [Thermoplasmata archaeon]|nr:50S ribosomal protein L3 [Thermoplasmata archaeon]
MARARPRRGSLGFSPRSRSVRTVPRIRSWAPGPKQPTVEGFAGFKVGMTHAFIVDYRKRSTTAGQEVSVPVTVVECPPLRVAAARLYQRHPYGSRVTAEVWGPNATADLARRMTPHPESSAEARTHFEKAEGEEVRLVVYTQPSLITGIGSKTPVLFEIRVSGEKPSERRTFALQQLGKELGVDELTKEGEFVDVLGVT